MYHFLYHIFKTKLIAIRGIKLTHREVDVLSIFSRGKGIKSVARILNISIKTAESHIRNISLKLGISGREALIELVEKSPVSDTLSHYYSILNALYSFEKTLLSLSEYLKDLSIICFIDEPKVGDERLNLLTDIKNHLQLAGIKVLKNDPDEYTCYILKVFGKSNANLFSKNNSFPEKTKKNVIFLVFQSFHLLNLREAKDLIFYDFTKIQSYQNSFFNLLSYVAPQCSNKIKGEKSSLIEVSKPDTALYQNRENYNNYTPNLSVKFSHIFYAYKNKINIFLPILLGAILFSMFFCSFSKNIGVRSDFIIPNRDIFLERPKLVKKINTCIKKQSNLKKIILIGPAGAGKTTLARYFALSSKKYIVWEFNASSEESLVQSIIHLLRILSENDLDRAELLQIDKMYVLAEKGKRAFYLLKKKLQQVKNWLLILDNISSFNEIKKYLPYDSKTWGDGTVLITTKNKRIMDALQFSKDIFINVDEITPHEKFYLFSKITQFYALKKQYPSEEKVKKLLDKIGPYPLDVSIIAYLAKNNPENWLSYEEKLFLDSNEKEEKKYISNIVNYDFTRRELISLSLKNILNVNKKFEDLFNAISHLCPENIPLTILYNWQPKTFVDQFVRHLEKQFLVTSRYLEVGDQKRVKVISMHSSIHQGIKNILPERPYIQSSFFTSVAQRFLKDNYTWGLSEKFLNEGASIYLKQLTTLLEAKLKIADTDYYKLKRKIANTYKVYRKFKLAEKYLYECLSFFKTLGNFEEVIKTLYSIGSLESYKGNQKLCEKFLVKAISMYKQHEINNPIIFSELYIYYGRYLYNEGKIQEARKAYKKAKSASNSNEMAFHVASLYEVIIDLDYNHGGSNLISIINASINFYQSKKDFFRVANAKGLLAWAYLNRSQLDEAEKLYREALIQYQNLFDESHLGIGWLKGGLGRVLLEKGKFKEAEKNTLQAIKSYKLTLGKDNHRELALLHCNLGRIYLRWGKKEKSTLSFKTAKEIFDKCDYEFSRFLQKKYCTAC